MPVITAVNPEALGAPKALYSRMMRVKASEFLFIAGMAASDRDGLPVGREDFDAQCRQVFANIEAALRAGGANWRNVAQFTSYLVDANDIPKFGAFRQSCFPAMFPEGVYPPNTLVIVKALAHEAFRVEVQAVAAL